MIGALPPNQTLLPTNADEFGSVRWRERILLIAFAAERRR